MTEAASIRVIPTGDIIQDIRNYCDLYDIPIDHFIEIISDQKVIPMIRGKAIEFNTYDYLKNNLDSSKWDVIKLNLNAQPNSPDEDVVVKHLQSGLNIKIEVKSAVRGSFSLGAKKVNVPFFKVKCHRSRSMLNSILNDRYLASDFDILVTSPSNSLVLGGEEFMLVSEERVLEVLRNYYRETEPLQIFKKSCKDIRFTRPQWIQEDFKGYKIVPRNPYVKLENDEHWKDISQIEETLEEIVQEKLQDHEE
jgi:hypothetical protein